MIKTKKTKVFAVLVCYNPSYEIIFKTLESIIAQVEKMYVIDNSDDESKILRKDFPLWDHEKIEFISLGKNTGIAFAQNIGIKKSIQNNADYILLSDQDTIYPKNYVKEILKILKNHENKEKIAAIAPDFLEMNRGGKRQGFVRFEGISLKKIFPITGCHTITQAIASGKIISANALEKIGFMEEKLFIDWVDLEWCWRALAKGFFIIGCADVVIQHTLGDTVSSVFNKNYPIRSPLRHYYIIRNAVHLSLRSKYITLRMRIHLFVKSIRNTIGFTVLGKPHLKHFRFVILGFYHGLKGRLGKY